MKGLGERIEDKDDEGLLDEWELSKSNHSVCYWGRGKYLVKIEEVDQENFKLELVNLDDDKHITSLSPINYTNLEEEFFGFLNDVNADLF